MNKDLKYIKKMWFLIVVLCLSIIVNTISANATINWGNSVAVVSLGQVVDSITMNGKTVNALYAPRNKVSDYDTNTTYSCAAFVKRFYSEVYGIGVYNLTPGYTPYSDSGSFYKTTTPKVGDIAASSGHWAIVKAVSGNNVTLIEQNCWNKSYTAAMVGRVLNSESSYWYWRWSGNGGDSSSDGNNPIGSVDLCKSDAAGQLLVGGWTYDPDNPSAQNDIHVYIGPNENDQEGHNLGPANELRQDVDDIHHCGAYHGFTKTINTKRTGNQRIRVFAINVGAGNNTLLYDKTVFIKSDSEPPALIGYSITDLNEKGYTITCTWSDNKGVTDVKFPTRDSEAGTDGYTWYQGKETGGSAWSFTFSDAISGKKYITHMYAYDAEGNYTCFRIPNAIEAKNDTTAPVFESVTLEQKEKGSVTLQVELSDDTGLGKLMHHKYLYYSMDENSSYITVYNNVTNNNINCWQNSANSKPIIDKKYTVEQTNSVECDSIVSYLIHAWDLSGNYAAGNQPQYNGNEIISYYCVKSGDIKGEDNRTINIVLKKGEEITLGAIRENLSQFHKLDGYNAYYDDKNERILKKSNVLTNTVNNVENEKKVILTGNEVGTEYVYFLNSLTGELCSSKISVEDTTTDKNTTSGNTTTTTDKNTTGGNTTAIKKPSKPGKVKLTSCKSKSKKNIKIRWKKVSGSDGYQVQWSRKRSFSSKRTSYTYGQTKVLDYGLKSKKKYYVRVRAYKDGNRANDYQYVYGSWSKVKVVKVK